MVKVNPIDTMLGLQVRKGVGKPTQYGRALRGHLEYGEEQPIHGPSQYGWPCYGKNRYAQVQQPWGIYRVRHERHKFFEAGDKERGKQYIQKEEFHIPANPQTVDQQANRSKFALAIAGWQGLTSEQKSVYNQRAVGKKMSGYNLYIREYMLSN